MSLAARCRRCAFALVALLVGVLAHPARSGASPSTPPTQLEISGDSWPGYTIAAFQHDAYYAGAIGTLSPVFTSQRGEAASRQDLATGDADLSVLSEGLTSSDLTTATANGITPVYVPFGETAVSVVVDITSGDATGRPGPPITHLNLKLSTLVKIFHHLIIHWDDPEILAENPDQQVGLEHAPANGSGQQIQTVTRRDSSPTNSALIAAILADPVARPIWDDYVTGLFSATKGGTPPDTVVDRWPDDTQANGVTSGEKGEISAVESLDGNGKPIVAPGQYQNQIGYVSPQWAAQYNATQVGLDPDVGSYVQPTPAAVQAAFASPGATFDASTGLWAIDYTKLTAAGAYAVPLPGYMAAPKEDGDPIKASAAAGFAKFAVSTQGQADVAATGMVALDPTTLAAANALANEILPQPSGGTETVLRFTATPGPQLQQAATSTATPAATTASPKTSTGSGSASTSAATAAGTSGGTTAASVTPSSQLPITGRSPVIPGGIALVLVGGGTLLRRRSLRRRAEV